MPWSLKMWEKRKNGLVETVKVFLMILLKNWEEWMNEQVRELLFESLT